MREIIYTCDNCERKFKYELKANDKYPQPLKEVFGKDFCRECIKNMVKQVNNL